MQQVLQHAHLNTEQTIGFVGLQLKHWALLILCSNYFGLLTLHDYKIS